MPDLQGNPTPPVTSIGGADALLAALNQLVQACYKISVTFAVNASNPLVVSSGGTGTSTVFTAGSVVFAGASGVYNQDNAQFFWDNTNFRLGLGTAVPNVTLAVTQNVSVLPAVLAGNLVQIGGVDGTASRVTIDAFAGTPQLIFRRADTSNAAPSAVQTGDTLGSIAAFGWGTAYTTTPRVTINAFAAENWTATANGTYLSISTTNKTSSGIVEQVRIQPTGGVTIGNGIIATDPGAGNLLVAGFVQVGTFTVAGLPAPGTAARVAFATNGRMFNGAGVLEGAGLGTGGLVSDNGTAWKIVGTNVTVSA